MEEVNLNSKENSVEDARPNESQMLMQELFSKYSKDNDTIDAQNLKQLFNEYYELTGNIIRLSSDLLNAEEYTLEQVLSCEVKSKVKIKLPEDTLQLLQSIKAEVIESASREILKHKFENHINDIKNIIKNSKTLINTLNDIFNKCKFVISDLVQILETEGEIEALTEEIESYVMNNIQENEELTSDRLLEELSNYLDHNSMAVTIDVNNEFSYYNEDEINKEVIQNELVKEEEVAPYKIEHEETKELPYIESLHKLKVHAPLECKDVQEKGSNDLFKENLKETIKTYENMVEELNNKGEDASNVKNLLVSLNNQLNSSKDLKKYSAQDKHMKGLKEIFYFYAKQRVQASGKKTFEQLNEEQNQLYLGYFSKILKDFHIKIESHKLKALFGRVAIAGKYLDFPLFVPMLERVAISVTKDNIDELDKTKAKLLKEQKNTDEIERQIRVLSNKTEEEIIEELYKGMEVDDVNKCRQKMIGFRSKQFIVPSNESKPAKLIPPRIPISKSKRAIEVLKNSSRPLPNDNVVKRNSSIPRNQNVVKNKHLVSESYNKDVLNEHNSMSSEFDNRLYKNRSNVIKHVTKYKKNKVESEKIREVTWSKLEGLSYGNVSEDFDPNVLISSDDKDDPELVKVLGNTAILNNPSEINGSKEQENKTDLKVAQSMNMKSYELAKKMDEQRVKKDNSVLRRIIKMQDLKIKRGLNAAKK